MPEPEVQPVGPVSVSWDSVASSVAGDVSGNGVAEDSGDVLVEQEVVSGNSANGSVQIHCRMCGGNTQLAPIHDVWTEAGYRFWKCLDCGSETSDRSYTPADYVSVNRDEYFIECLGSWEAVLRELNTNVWLFEKNTDLKAKLFLDVGYHDGAMLQRMREQGCICFGFDVLDNKSDKIAERAGIECESLFHGNSLDETPLSELIFDLIQCREVIEHVHDPARLMRQMSRLLASGGLLQVQTPTPCGIDSRIPYQIQHLTLIAPKMLRALGLSCGLEIVETMYWPHGQCVIFRKRC